MSQSTPVLLSKSTPVLLSKQYSCTPVQTVLLYSCPKSTPVLLSKSTPVLLSPKRYSCQETAKGSIIVGALSEPSVNDAH